MSNGSPIPTEERDSILQALRAGVVPKTGLRHIQVGRAREIEAIVRDMARVSQGGAALRFIIGDYGAGKTLFLGLSRLIALENDFVVVNADLGPSRRLHAKEGEARLLFSDLVAGLATQEFPQTGALAAVLERFSEEAQRDARSKGISLVEHLAMQLAPLQALAFGFDFMAVLIQYSEAQETGDRAIQAAALRWLRAEYSNRAEARDDLGVRSIIDDARVYDCLKLLARFVAIAGYSGLLVALDEMVNLYKLNNPIARNANFEQLLRLINDVLSGGASHLCILMGGTPEFLMDGRRGLYSNPALKSRLARSHFSHGEPDCSGPVINLEALTLEHLFVLLTKIRTVFQAGDPGLQLPDEALVEFMRQSSKILGDGYFRTPRQTVIAFVSLLFVLAQNPSLRWNEAITSVDLPTEHPDLPILSMEKPPAAEAHHDELSGFKL